MDTPNLTTLCRGLNRRISKAIRQWRVGACVRACVCVRACACVRVRACVRARASERECLCTVLGNSTFLNWKEEYMWIALVTFMFQCTVNWSWELSITLSSS